MTVTIGTYGATDATGWTVITETSPSGEGSGFSGAGTRKIYVDSNAADDTGDGSQANPKKNIMGASGGYSLLRTGKPDWLLLKKGGVWTDQQIESSTGSNFGLSGQDADNPMLVSSYGVGARPLIQSSFGRNGIGFVSGSTGNFVAVVGIEFYAYTRDPGNGSFNNRIEFNASISGTTMTVNSVSSGTITTPMQIVGTGVLDNTVVTSGSGSTWTVSKSQTLASTDIVGTTSPSGIFMFSTGQTWFLVEDCKFSFYGDNLVLEPSVAGSNFYLRRNVIVDAYSIFAHAQGIYADRITGLLLEENFFDSNGFNHDVTGCDQTVFNRNAYLQYTVTGVTARGNVSANSSSEGVQFRGNGATVENNLFLRNSYGFDVGHFEGDPIVTNMYVNNNVVLESEDKDFGPRGVGINVMNANGSGVLITNNIIAHGASVASNAKCANLDAYDGSASSGPLGYGTDGTHGIILTNNIIFDWHLGINDQGSVDGHGAANTTSPNAIDLTGINSAGYPDPTRTVASYAGTLGLTASLDGFLDAARAQSKDNWNPDLTADAVNTYIRAGFGVGVTTVSQRPGKARKIHYYH